MKLSICSSCLEKAILDVNGFYFSVFGRIADSNTAYQVVNDSKGIIFDSYKEVLAKDNAGLLSFWLEAIAMNKKILKVENKDIISENIHVNTLVNTFGSRTWLSNNENSYHENLHDITDHGIEFLFANEAPDFFKTMPVQSSVNYQELTFLLVHQLSLMMDRKQTVRLENLHNDELTTSLEKNGYCPLDQTRRGTTGDKGNPGELDILVKTNANVKVSIIESLRASSCGEKNRNISSHLNKLLNDYDTCGLKVNYMIVYCEAANFGSFWDSYLIYMDNINYKPDFSSKVPQISISDTGESISKYSDIRVARAIHNRNGRNLEVYHIVCNMHVKKG